MKNINNYIKNLEKNLLLSLIFR